MTETYHPSDSEKRLSEDAYLVYATGVALLRDPDNEVNLAINTNEMVYTDLDAVVFRAEVLMFDGLRQVIRLAHPKNIRTNLGKVEERFTEALPYMIHTVDRVSEFRADELLRLDAAFDYIAPKPMTNETVYKYICRRHLEKLSTVRLLGGLVPAPVFETILRARNMSHLNSSLHITA